LKLLCFVGTERKKAHDFKWVHLFPQVVLLVGTGGNSGNSMGQRDVATERKKAHDFKWVHLFRQAVLLVGTVGTVGTAWDQGKRPSLAADCPAPQTAERRSQAAVGARHQPLARGQRGGND
jgi:hypothetical protein